MKLKDVRKEHNLSQLEASNIVNIPLRTYVRYENDDSYGDSLKRQMMISLIIDKCSITETKGILSISDITAKVTYLFDNEYKGQIDFCYLFGSYAKGKASDKSDVDLCINTSLTGLKFVGLIERLRQTLHKKIDLIRVDELSNNIQLMTEIMKTGQKIYG